MTVLCIETSTQVCSAALCQDGKPLKQLICREGSNHAQLLPRYVEQLLHYAAEQGLRVEAVALSEGPGSYTGLRIGTSTAKGLCYGLHVPLIPVPTLQVLCASAQAQTAMNGTLCPMLDARRMEVYTALYDAQLQALSEVQACVVENETSLPATEGEVWYFGDGAAKCAAVLSDPHWHLVPDIVPEAQYMGEIAERAKGDGRKAKGGVDVAYFEPFYLKEFIAAQSHVKGLK